MIASRLRGMWVAAQLILFAAASTGSNADAQFAGMPGVMSSPGPVTNTNRPNPGAAIDTRSQVTMVPEGFSKLAIAPGFLLQLTVLDDADYNGNYRVDQQGNIVLPIIGAVRVAGSTAKDAGSAVTRKLLDGEILKDPQVNVTVLEYVAPQVTILGEVSAPGRYPLLAPAKLTDVLALAGGTTVTAGREIVITGEEARPIRVPLPNPRDSRLAAPELFVHPGDTVDVERAGIVYVLGAVVHPGGYVMAEGGRLSVMQAISMANGATISASLGKIVLLRRNPNGGVEQITLPFKKMQTGKAGDVALQASDILYVPNSKVKSALVSSQGILAAATSASIYAATLY